MINKNDKKGAVELSLNLIIMLIIGLTVLGLVITFVYNLIGGATDSFRAELSKVEQRQKDEVLGKAGAFAVGPDPLTLKSGGDGKFFLKFRNLGVEDLNFDAYTSTGSEWSSGVSIDTKLELKKSDISGDCQPKMFSPPFDLNSGDEKVLEVLLVTKGTSCKGGDKFYLTTKFTPVDGTTFTETVQVSIED